LLSRAVLLRHVGHKWGWIPGVPLRTMQLDKHQQKTCDGEKQCIAHDANNNIHVPN